MPVPGNDEEFNSYLPTSNTYLNASTGGTVNYLRLGLSVTERNTWDTYVGSTWPPVWTKYTDDSQRTKAITLQKNNLKKEITEFMNLLLIRMATMPDVNETDINTMKLVIQAPKVPRGPINAVPYAGLESFGGARLQARTRTNEDSTRASMHPLADAIEMRYSIGTVAPVTPDAAPLFFISPKALFDFNVGVINGGKTLFAFFRWVNFSNPENNGEWTTVHSATIQA